MATMVTKGAANHVMRHGLLMRDTFSLKNFDIAHWFPSHMAKGLIQMQSRLRSIDCIVEIHDARLPISGRNPNFEHMIYAIKPHLLILNKIDLTDLSNGREEIIKKYYTSKGINKIMFTDCRLSTNPSVQSIVPTIIKMMQGTERFNRSLDKEFNAMIIGIPNVGKSSLINALRVKYLKKGKGTPVGALPGVTRSVLNRIKICSNPNIYVYDTPGVTRPRIKSVEMGVKLALAGTIQDHFVGEDFIADYLLYKLNCDGNHSYVNFLNLDAPSDDIQAVLSIHATRNKKLIKVRTHNGLEIKPDIRASAIIFLRAFRSGKLGPVMLDDLLKLHEYD